MLEVTSALAYIIQGTGVAAALGSLYLRTHFKDKMVLSCLFSIFAGLILGIYSIVTLQWIMVILNMVTVYMSYNGYKLWRGK